MSLDAESLLGLAEDEVDVIVFLAPHGGRVHTDPASPERRWLELHPRADPAQRYIAQLTWTRYPYDPPSITFVSDIAGPAGTTSAWPLIPGYRAPNDICRPFTAEGYNLHSEWRSGPYAWTIEPNPYLRVAAQLQDDLDTRYQGRAA